MKVKRFLSLGVAALTTLVSWSCNRASAEQARIPVVRLAELEIDPTQLETYKAALREEIEASVRAEPGVLSLYAVSVKSDPTRVRLFEMYADSNAYDAHIASPHFVKYKTATKAMVKSLTLTETVPLSLGTKRSEILGAYVTLK